MKENAIAIEPKEEVEKVLILLWYKIEYIGRSRCHASVEAIFGNAEMAKSVSSMSFKNEKIILIPAQKGNRSAKINIEHISPMFDLEWVAEVVNFHKEQQIQILSMAQGKRKFGAEKSLILTVLVVPETLESVPDRILLEEAASLSRG